MLSLYNSNIATMEISKLTQKWIIYDYILSMYMFSEFPM